MNKMPKVNYDKETEKWLKGHPGAQTTVCMCDTCGLFYKPGLGHTCISATIKVGNSYAQHVHRDNA